MGKNHCMPGMVVNITMAVSYNTYGCILHIFQVFKAIS
jgi:hypothetical protein